MKTYELIINLILVAAIQIGIMVGGCYLARQFAMEYHNGKIKEAYNTGAQACQSAVALSMVKAAKRCEPVTIKSDEELIVLHNEACKK